MMIESKVCKYCRTEVREDATKYAPHFDHGHYCQTLGRWIDYSCEFMVVVVQTKELK